jgi:hypothetical protein
MPSHDNAASPVTEDGADKLEPGYSTRGVA